MRRIGLVGVILACSCQPGGASNSAANGRTNSDTPYVSSNHESPSTPHLAVGEESAVIDAAAQEFYGSRLSEWNTGDFIAVEPAWSTGQFDSSNFDKALAFWTTKFGNDGMASAEETLKRIRETLNTASAPAGGTSNVTKGIETMDLDSRLVIVPSTFFNDADPWVPGAVTMKNRAGKEGSFRVLCALTYPLFSGDGRYAFLQMNRVKSGHAYGQLHFFVEKVEGSWRALAVGRVAE